MLVTAEQVLSYARCLYNRGDIVEWRAIGGGRVESGWVLAEELSKQVDMFSGHNQSGLNIYVGANPRSEAGKRSDANVKTFQTVFVDFDHMDNRDGESLDEQACSRIENAGLPAPTLRVFSGHGIHAYWRLLTALSPEQWVDTQERLIATLDTDRVIKNPERIMRLPGFRNVKDPTKPVDCFVLSADPKHVVDVSDLLDHCKSVTVQPAACRPKVLGRPPMLEAYGRAMLYAAKWQPCSEGERNSEAYRHACQLVNDFSLGEDDAWGIVSGWNQTNVPPLPESELRKAFDDAKKYAKRVPGSKLVETRSPQRRIPMPATSPIVDPASELGDLIESQIDGRYTNIAWPWPVLTDMGQCLTPQTRTVLVGGAGASKSLAVLQAVAMWVESGIKCAVLELERSRDFHLARVLAQRVGVADLTKPKWVRENAETARRYFADHREYLNLIGGAIHTVPRTFTVDHAAEWAEARIADGCRVIVLDPVTALTRGKDCWADDEQFVSRLEKAARGSGTSVVCVTHPKKGGSSLPDIDNLAGGAAWSRFPDAVIWLESHDMRVSTIRTVCGTDEQEYNRTVWLLKTRSGDGEHLRLAYRFQTGKAQRDTGALTLTELGVVMKTKKKGHGSE